MSSHSWDAGTVLFVPRDPWLGQLLRVGSGRTPLPSARIRDPADASGRPAALVIQTDASPIPANAPCSRGRGCPIIPSDASLLPADASLLPADSCAARANASVNPDPPVVPADAGISTRWVTA